MRHAHAEAEADVAGVHHSHELISMDSPTIRVSHTAAT